MHDFIWLRNPSFQNKQQKKVMVSFYAKIWISHEFLTEFVGFRRVNLRNRDDLCNFSAFGKVTEGLCVLLLTDQFTSHVWETTPKISNLSLITIFLLPFLCAAVKTEFQSFFTVKQRNGEQWVCVQDIEKPRGRKRGVTSGDDQESKPKRGRKKATANTTAAADSEDPWDEDNRPEDEQNSPPKKGRRGRPPKSATPSQDTPAKGRRGRKKAAPPPEEDEEEEEEDEERGEEEVEDEDEDDDRSSENMEVKTRGGRQARAPRRSQGYENSRRTQKHEMCFKVLSASFVFDGSRFVLSSFNRSDSAESTPQKRRGRPPKSAQPAAKKPT